MLPPVPRRWILAIDDDDLLFLGKKKKKKKKNDRRDPLKSVNAESVYASKMDPSDAPSVEEGDFENVAPGPSTTEPLDDDDLSFLGKKKKSKSKKRDPLKSLNAEQGEAETTSLQTPDDNGENSPEPLMGYTEVKMNIKLLIDVCV